MPSHAACRTEVKPVSECSRPCKPDRVRRLPEASTSRPMAIDRRGIRQSAERRSAVGAPHLGDLAGSHGLAGVMTLDDDAVSDGGVHVRLLLRLR